MAATAEGTAATGLLTELAPKVRQALEQAEAHLEHLLTEETRRREAAKEVIDVQRDEITRMRRVLTAVDPEYAAAQQQKYGNRATPRKAQPSHIGVARSNGIATGFGITAEGVAPYVDYILKKNEAGQKYFTQKEVYTAVKQDQGKGSAAFKFLRSIHFLRKAGRDPKQNRRERWCIDQPDAFDKYFEEADRKSNGRNGDH